MADQRNPITLQPQKPAEALKAVGLRNQALAWLGAREKLTRPCGDLGWCLAWRVGEDAELRTLLEELADDADASANRVVVCETIANGLVRLGHVLWVAGYLIGPGRVSGASPFRFGDDRAVGVATVSQIGGELARAAVDLLRANNRYAACALIRQLVEVEYLAAAFAEEHDIR